MPEAQLQKSDIKLALLIEHQSTPDPWMPVRLLEYWAGYLSNQRKEHPGWKIPAAYLMLFYHGEQAPYPYSMRLQDCIDDPLHLTGKIFTEPLPLIDVNQLSDEQLARQQWIGPLTRAMKHIREIDITPYLLSILQELRWQTNDPVAKELLRQMFFYLCKAGNINKTDGLDTVIDQLAEQTTKEEVMTIAEMLRAEGMERGREKGREEGREKVALNLLRSGLTVDFVAQVADLTPERVLEIRKNLAAEKGER